MTGFLFDENLPARIRFSPSLPIIAATALGEHPSDTDLWNHARDFDLVIVTKDADFSHQIMLARPPPRVVHLRFGNLRKAQFHELLLRAWPHIEHLIRSHKLLNVYRDRIEAVF